MQKSVLSLSVAYSQCTHLQTIPNNVRRKFSNTTGKLVPKQRNVPSFRSWAVNPAAGSLEGSVSGTSQLLHLYLRPAGVSTSLLKREETMPLVLTAVLTLNRIFFHMLNAFTSKHKWQKNQQHVLVKAMYLHVQ